uniref:Spindle and kinetochore associated complex subunit 3 n=1 Tax=Strix occidentalis caurina TaxID=311401 RepID=A0A8D0EIL4_STROC
MLKYPFFLSKPFYVNMHIKDYEDEAPIRALYDFLCEIRTLKEDINDSCGKSCSEKQAIREFMKASEILMQRNAADLGKIRELFQKYGYKPHGKDFTGNISWQYINSDSTMSVQNKSDKKADDVPHLPGCPEKPQVPKDPLRNPQLSDFGLSQYAFSRPWSAVKRQHTTNAYQENSRSKTPLKTQAPSILPKTPKCMLKMDDYVCITPKLEHFGISEHTMCMNEDYTMSLIRKTAQTSKNSRTNNTVLSRSPQTNEQPPPSHTGTPKFPDFEARWLKTEAEVTELVTESDSTDKQCIEDSISFTVSSDEYLKHLRDPSPPKIKHYDQLLNTPPPPEITRIPDDVLQILSKYDHKVDSSKAKEMKTKTGNTTRYESDFTDYCNKENRYY